MAEPKNNAATIPALGLIGVSFAAVLVIANVRPFDDDLRESASAFAFAIPLGIAGYVTRVVIGPKANLTWLKRIINVYSISAIVIAQIGCVIGLYKFFRHISSDAGSTFLTVTLGCYLVGSILLAVGAGDFLRQKHSEREKAAVAGNSSRATPKVETRPVE